MTEGKRYPRDRYSAGSAVRSSRPVTTPQNDEPRRWALSRTAGVSPCAPSSAFRTGVSARDSPLRSRSTVTERDSVRHVLFGDPGTQQQHDRRRRVTTPARHT